MMSDEGWNEHGCGRRETADPAGIGERDEVDAEDCGADQGTSLHGHLPPERPTDRTILTSPSLSCLCVVRHGRDSCIVLAPSYGAVVRVARERRRLLGISGAERIHPIPMIECAELPARSPAGSETVPTRSRASTSGEGDAGSGAVDREEDEGVIAW